MATLQRQALEIIPADIGEDEAEAQMVVRDPSRQALVPSKHIAPESEGIEAVKPRVGTTGPAITPSEGPHV